MERQKRAAVLIFILALTFIVLSPCLKNGFVNLDDGEYILYNPQIRAVSLSAARGIFTSFWFGNYHPITTMSYALEYHFFGLNAFVYHLDSLILHLFNCLLVFWLVLKLSKRHFAAFAAALLFAIHPLHVESVAWAAERKDLLYSFFFILSLISYLYYINNKRRGFCRLAFILFILSCFSKAMAVSLPFVLLAIDYLFNRKPDKRLILEKVPFFAVSIIFGIIAVMAQQSCGAFIHGYKVELGRAVFICSFAALFYLERFIMPLKLSCVYPYPSQPVALLPVTFLISPVIVSFFIFVLYRSARYTRKAVFGMLFFVITIAVPGFQIIPMGGSLASDRYTYVAAIGIFYLIGEFLAYLYRNNIKYIKWISVLILIISTAWFSAISWRRCGAWKDGFTLFSDALSKYPNSLAYNNRGTAYIDRGEFEKAAQDFKKAIWINPKYAPSYVNLCNVYNRMHLNRDAVMAGKKAVELAPDDAKAYFNLGNAYADMNKAGEAVAAYRKALQIRWDYAEAYNNLATIYVIAGENKKAIALLGRALEINPSFADAHYNLAVVYSYEKRYDLAIRHCDESVRLGYKAEADFLEFLKPYRKIKSQ